MCHRYKIRLIRSPTRNGSVTKEEFLIILEELKNMLLFFPSFVSRILQCSWNQVKNCLCSPILRCGKASKYSSFFWPCHLCKVWETQALLLLVRRGRSSCASLLPQKNRECWKLMAFSLFQSSTTQTFLLQTLSWTEFPPSCLINPCTETVGLIEFVVMLHISWSIPHPSSTKWQQASASQVMGQKIHWNYFALQNMAEIFLVSLNFSFVQWICPDHKITSEKTTTTNQYKNQIGKGEENTGKINTT